MSSLNVAVTITARDKASAAIVGVGNAAKKATSTVATLGSVGGRALVSLSVASVGLGVAYVAMKKLSAVASAFMEKSLELRGENDKLTKAFREQQQKVDALRVSVGDTLVIAYTSLTKQFDPLIKKAREFIITNRETMLLGIVEFFQTLGEILIFVVARSLIVVTRNVAFFQVTWEMLKAVVNAALSFIVGGLADLLAMIVDLASKIPMLPDAIKTGLKSAADATRTFASTFTETFSGAVSDNIAAIDKLLAEEASAEEEIEKAGLSRMQRLDRVTREAAEAIRKLSAEARNELAATGQDVAGIGEKAGGVPKKIAEDFKSAADDIKESLSEVYSGVTTVMDSIRGSMATAKDATDALFKGMIAAMISTINVLLDIVRKKLIIHAVDAAAASMAQGSAIGGPAVGAALGAVALSMVMGLMDKLPEKFAHGGLVTGGTRGVDSVPALLMPGEYVLTVAQVEAIRGALGGLSVASTSARVRSDGQERESAAGPNVVVNISTQAMPTKTELTRYVRSAIVPAMADLRAQRLI